jgi:hypothetical protein
MSSYRLSMPHAAIIGCAVNVLAVAWFLNSTHQWSTSIFILCPVAAFTAMLVLGSDDVLERMAEWIAVQPIRVIAAPVGLWSLYFVYATAMGIAGIRPGIIMAMYLGLPFLILWRHQFWLHPVAIVLLWFPLEFGILRQILMTGPGADLHYVFAQTLAIDTGVVGFAVWNRMPGIGYRFLWNRSAMITGLANFAIFAAIAIPVGLAIGFIHYSFSFAKLISAPLVFAGIFFFTALPEEFLFRGLIQNWLERATMNRSGGLIAASLIFGASHLNNGPPVPNYKYFFMASIAGIFYGRTWQRTGILMASSLTHALVDTFWGVFFR